MTATMLEDIIRIFPRGGGKGLPVRLAKVVENFFSKSGKRTFSSLLPAYICARHSPRNKHPHELDTPALFVGVKGIHYTTRI